MTAFSASELDVDSLFNKDDNAAASSEYLKPNHLKVLLWGVTYAFPANENTDEKWTVENLKERTFDEFRQLLIDFFIGKSKELAAGGAAAASDKKENENDKNDKEKEKEKETKENEFIAGNLTIDDIGFKLHGDAIEDRNRKGELYKIGDTKYIGDVLYLQFNPKNRKDIIVPSWITYCIKNEKKLRKERNKQWNKVAADYADKSGQKMVRKEHIAHLKDTGNWTVFLTLDNSHKEEIDIINGERNEMNGDSGSNNDNNNNEEKNDPLKLEYLQLNDDLTVKKGIEVAADITVGKLRELIFLEIMKDNVNKVNLDRFSNDGNNKSIITLKYKFSVWVEHSDETEMRHMGMGIKNGTTIKVGYRIPLWYKVTHKLKLINFRDLNEKNPNPSNAKKDIKSLIAMIKDETRKY